MNSQALPKVFGILSFHFQCSSTYQNGFRIYLSFAEIHQKNNFTNKTNNKVFTRDFKNIHSTYIRVLSWSCTRNETSVTNRTTILSLTNFRILSSCVTSFPFMSPTNIIINNTMLHKQCPKGGCLEWIHNKNIYLQIISNTSGRKREIWMNHFIHVQYVIKVSYYLYMGVKTLAKIRYF